jgi:pyruvate, water dikinase
MIRGEMQMKHSRGEKEDVGDSPNWVKWFSELSFSNVNIAGGKGANLGEMYRNNFPVPPGFVIVSGAYNKFLNSTGLDEKIYQRLSVLDTEKTEELELESKKIREMIENAEMPQDMAQEIIEAYEHLNVDETSLKGASKDALLILKKGREGAFVAVRSSATAEDGAEASFAGQQSTFLNVKGNSSVIKAVLGCWASLFTARSVYYRIKKGFKHEETAIAVVIQMMVNPEKSGVMFTKDPVKNTDNVVIEAVYGLGEGIVSGMINPDHYEVNPNEEIINVRISEKKLAIIRNSSGQNETVPLTHEKGKSQVLNAYEIKRLAQYGTELEKHYKKAQDIEFAVDSGKIYIVQTRPITTLGRREDYEKKASENQMSGEVILSGISASPGVGSGIVKIVHDMSELNKIKKGDVLVTQMTNPDMVVAMQKANAILTDEGGLTSHAAIVSREMGIPCVVGSRFATTTLKEGEVVTIDGYTGRVYRGVVEGKKVEIKPIVKTRTHIKVIVDLPDYAERASLTKTDAVGLTRMEGIIAEGGKHPYYFTKIGDTSEYEEIIFRGVSKIASYFDEVWVRTSDIRSDEYEHLEGAPKWKEANPMLGMHGIRASLKHPELLKAELRALKRVAESGKRIGVMMPQIISAEEVRMTKKYMAEVGFHDNIALGIMVETPAAVQTIDEMCDEGIKFISFGTNDLTQFTLALDRGNEECQSMYNEMHPAILRQIAHVIKVCKARGVQTSICGQAASRKEMAKFLVEQGIDSMSVNADAAGELSEYIRELENSSGQEIIDPTQNDEVRDEEINEVDEEVTVIEDTSDNGDSNSEQLVESREEDNANPDSVSAQPINDYSDYNVEVEEVSITSETIIQTTEGEATQGDFEEELLVELTKEEPAPRPTADEERGEVLLDIF